VITLKIESRAAAIATTTTKKRSHDAHHHDERYLSSQDESPEEHRTPEMSDDEGMLSANSEESHRDVENYHVDTVLSGKLEDA